MSKMDTEIVLCSSKGTLSKSKHTHTPIYFYLAMLNFDKNIVWWVNHRTITTLYIVKRHKNKKINGYEDQHEWEKNKEKQCDYKDKIWIMFSTVGLGEEWYQEGNHGWYFKDNNYILVLKVVSFALLFSIYHIIYK